MARALEILKMLETKPKSELSWIKDRKVPLDPEERKEVFKRKAVWHMNGGGPSSAITKGYNKKGELKYATYTHRACAIKDTLKGAIGAFKFIKTTA